MHGHLRSIELPIYGAKVIALREGTLDMHGRSTIKTWVHLGITANNGSTAITLLESVNWPVNSQIVIATSGDRFSQKQSEIRRITNISSDGLILTLDKALQYTHLGMRKTLNSTTIEIRAEVGLLSHNVVFQGSVTETWNETIEECPDGFNPDEFAVQTCYLGRYGQEIGSDQFGAMIIASQGDNMTNDSQRVIVRLSNIEIFNVGQAFRLDRYAVHFHRNGNMSESYIKSCSIYQSFNRAIHIQASSYITIENNVIYNIMGSALFLSDGNEIGHVLRRNLLVFVRSSSSLLNEDLTPAAFWVSNPNNIIENNAVAGATHYGYWYRLSDTLEGLSYVNNVAYCPNRQPFGRFFNNSVHSTGRFGVWVYPEYAPTISGSCTDPRPSQAVFQSVVSWNNNKGIELIMARTIKIKYALIFDNADTGISYVTAIDHQTTNPVYLRPTFYDVDDGSSVTDSVIIGDTGISIDPIIPATAGLVVMWDRGLCVQNVTFINFSTNKTRALQGPTILGRCTDHCGGWIIKFSNMSFINVSVRGIFRWEYDTLYYDEDGSLGGLPDSVIMAPDGLTNSSTACTVATDFENAVQCPLSEGSWLRFSFRDYRERNQGRLFISDNENSSTIVRWLQQQLTYPNGYLATLRANQTYTLQFEVQIPEYDFRYTGVIYDVAPGNFLIIQHPINAAPARANITVDRTMIPGLTMSLSGSTSDNGDWYYDNTTSLFSYIIKNPSTANTSIDIEVSIRLYFCPCYNCGCPTTTTTSATTETTTSTTTQTTTSATTTTETTETTTMYIPPIQPAFELPSSPQWCQFLDVRYWSNDNQWTFGPQDYPNWPGMKPDNDRNIFVPRCIWLVIDYPLPTIRSLKIEGVVEFQQGGTYTMYVDNIIINGGRLIAGTPTSPFNGRIDIIMRNSGPVTVQLPLNFPAVQPRVIYVLGGLDLNGIPSGITWTRLADTAAAGQNIVILRDAVSWNVGDEFIITTTDTSISHTERHRIANIENATVIHTEAPLVYTHIVIENTLPNGQVVNVAAAVGLLTHNIRIANQNSGSSLSGFRIIITDYQTNVWHIYSNSYYSAYYKGYARLSNTQFIGFGQLEDSYYSDQRSGIYMNHLGDYQSNRPTFIDSCSFDSGFNAAIGMKNTNGIPITNNVIYKTYRSGISVTGMNNIIQNNLVSTVYWVGTGQDLSVAQFSTNNDAAIMTRDVASVTLTNNLVAGAERLAYRIQGESCGGSGIYIPSNIFNVYSDNEAHSVMSGVNLWPTDKGFIYDRQCVTIKGFKVYKAWYYAFYINTPRNITIDSCSSIDSQVGIFTYIVGPSALTHVPIASRVNIMNSMIVGSITSEDCNDQINLNSVNIRFAPMAMPKVSANASSNSTGGRSGIVFPAISRNNYMPVRPWTGIGTYPCLDGLMSIINTTLAFFNDTCGRHDVAIQVSQSNDDGQFPIKTSSMFAFNISRNSLIFNGQPNLGVVNPSRCGDMDCDGLKKNLIIDTDGSLFGQPSSVFSQAEALWGNQQHGIGDFRIPLVAKTDLNGHRINLNLTYPYRGISRTNSCSLEPLWGMYICNMTTDYRMLIIESMDSDTEKRRISPVAIMSNSGYIDLINGPQDQSVCNGYSCRKRISTFMAIVQSGQIYQIFFSSTPPRKTRFRLLNADSTIKCVLALHYDSLQQIDVYANTMYIPPTNRDLSAPGLILLDLPNNVTLSSDAGSNYFDRTYQMAYFAIDGSTTIDIRVSPLLILSFGFPPMDPASFYSTNLVANLAALLNISPSKIRRVNIISASNQTRIKRQSSNTQSSVQVQVELRDEPRSSSTADAGIGAEILSNIASSITNDFQTGNLQAAWKNLNITNGTAPSTMNTTEPFDNSSSEIKVINRLVLVTQPSDCRQWSPCTIQPVLIAYDQDGNVIQKLGSNDRPWQIKASIVNRSNLVLPGGTANYSNGQTQYTLFCLPDIGPVQIQFSLVLPDGVNSSFLNTTNITIQTASVTVTQAILTVQQVNNVYVVNLTDKFDLSVMPIDNVTGLRLGKIQWGTWRWLANVTLLTLPKYNPPGSLINSNTSRTIVDLTAGVVNITNLSFNATGMYILQIQLRSNDDAFNIGVISNAILVKQSNDTFVTDINALSSNITLSGDFDALNASNQLEIKRAMLYNYLISIQMPLISDITFIKGSVISLIELGAQTQQVYESVSKLLSDIDIIPGMSVLKINVNGITYAAKSSTSNSSNDGNISDNVGWIVGLVVGLVGGVLVIFGVIWGYHARERKLVHRRLGIHDSDPDNPTEMEEDSNPIPRLYPKDNLPDLEMHESSPVSIFQPETNRVLSAQSAVSKDNLQDLETHELSPVSRFQPEANRVLSAQSVNRKQCHSAASMDIRNQFNKSEKLIMPNEFELISFD